MTGNSPLAQKTNILLYLEKLSPGRSMAEDYFVGVRHRAPRIKMLRNFPET